MFVEIIADDVESDLSLVHPDDVDWFITLDETHHELTTRTNKGGSMTTRYANSSFARSGDRLVESSSHTTGVYGFTLRGECLPPLYILSSSAMNVDNYKFDVRICETLPEVVASYGQDVPSSHASRIAVRRKGSMDTGLWHLLHRQVYVKLYEGRLAPEPVRDPMTGKMLKGPLIVKTDSGPGRLSSEAESIDFREEMANLGVYILLSLPNGTECQAELDQMFSDFQPRCKRSAIRIVGMKMKSRLDALRRAETATTPITVDSSSDSDESSDEDEDDRSVAVAAPVEAPQAQSITKVKLCNLDLGHVINGFPGDPAELRPFDFCFTKEKIIKTWINVGFMPHTGNAALDPKVRHELGEGGAPQEAQVRLEHLVEDYATSRNKLMELGFNGEVLDLKPKTVAANSSSALTMEEEDLIEEIVGKKIISSAGGLYKAGVVIANCRAVTQAARRSQAALLEAIGENLEKRKAKERLDRLNARAAFRKWVDQGRKETEDRDPDIKSKKDAIAIIRVLLPKLSAGGPKVTLTSFKTLKDCVHWLGNIRRGTTWHEELEAMLVEDDADGADEEALERENEDGVEGTAD